MKYNYVISAQGNSVDENIRSALREIGLKKIFVEKIPDVQSILVDQNNSVNENILEMWDKSRKKLTRYPKVYEEVRRNILSKGKMTNREFAELIVETCRRQDFAESTIGLLLVKILIKKLKDFEYDNIEYNIEQDSLCLKTKTSLINHELFKQGIIQAQDSSSMKVCEVVNPLPNSTVLDVCSAPGGKSMYMACLMNNQGYIMSCDKYEEKIKKIKQNAINQGINIIDARVLDGTNADYNKQFDNVLVDAPCSGLGTINHKPDLKYRISLNDINDIVSLQEKILLNASRYVKLNGYLTYSTCTINQQENEEQTNKFLNTHKDFEKTEEILILPSNTNDGFYICKMKKVR